MKHPCLGKGSGAAFEFDMPIAKNNALHDCRIKVLVCLQFVATGYTFDTLEELSGIGQETC